MGTAVVRLAELRLMAVGGFGHQDSGMGFKWHHGPSQAGIGAEAWCRAESEQAGDR